MDGEPEAGRPGPRLSGLRAAAARLLAAPWLLWSLAAVFALRDLALWALAPDRPDARNWWKAGRILLSDPRSLYPLTADAVARHGLVIPGGEGFLGPPAQVVLAAPFALLPLHPAVELWTALDAVCLVAGLFLLDRALAPRGPARALFWLVAAWFPPLFAEVDAGQRGGLILLLAMGALALQLRRPVAAGVLGGLAGALKYYPLAIGLGAPPGRRLRVWAALAASFAVATIVTFWPFGHPGRYVTGVLLPAATVRTSDCAVTSVPSLWQRTLGGASYALPAAGGVAFHSAPLDLPALASALSLATALAVAAAAVLAARASGWDPLFGVAAGFALGALVPSEVYPYQWLPLLPLVLAVAVRAVAAAAWTGLAVLLVLLLGFLRQPCELPFPNLWTLAGLAVYATCLWHHGLFRSRQIERR